jgi:hypothetical protein
LWHGVRTIEEKNHDLFKYLLANVDCAVDAISWLYPVHLAYGDVPALRRNAIAELDFELVPA